MLVHMTGFYPSLNFSASQHTSSLLLSFYTFLAFLLFSFHPFHLLPNIFQMQTKCKLILPLA